MHVYIHDYCGHVGQIEVARALVRRGHDVTFSYCDQFSTPRGDLGADEAAGTLRVRPISIGEDIDKKNHFKRQWQDVRYGRALLKDVSCHLPDIVLSANTPLVPQRSLLRHCQAARIPFVYWWTDVYSDGARYGVGKKSRWLGKLIGLVYQRLERHLIQDSQAVVAITESFADIARSWGASNRMYVIPVAAPVDRICHVEKDNAWSARHGLATTFNIVYTGTLGTKHPAGMFARLARCLEDIDHVRVVVVSEGVGMETLRREKETHNLTNLILLAYQPFDEYPQVLGAADVLVTVLDKEASRFSTPSKVISYLCAGKPQVAVIPADNVAARLIRNAKAGLVSEPGEYDVLEQNVKYLMSEEITRRRLGANGRRYAEAHLPLDRLIGDYEQIISQLARESESR